MQSPTPLVQPPCTDLELCLLTVDDLNELHPLEEQAGLELGTAYRVYDRDTLKLILAQELSMGVRTKDGLAGFRLTYIVHPLSEQMAQILKASDTQHGDIGYWGGLYIRPELRGRRLGRQLGELNLKRAAAQGCSRIYATCAPGNLRILRLLFKLGFQIQGQALLYGGHPRYIVQRWLQDAPYRCTGPVQLSPCADWQAHEALFAEGWIGMGMQQHNGQDVFLFSRPAELVSLDHLIALESNTMIEDPHR